MSPATALRQLQQAQAGLKKARQLMRAAREAGGDGEVMARVLNVGWTGLAKCHKLLAEIPIGAATDPVLTKQLAVQRYATALLVRLRRIVRNEGEDLALDHDDDDDADDEI